MRRFAVATLFACAVGAALTMVNPSVHPRVTQHALKAVTLAMEERSAQAAALPTTTTTTTTTPTTTTTTTAPPAPPTTAASGGTTQQSAAPLSDATSVDTPDWACIRRAESGDGTASPNIYGILGPAWSEYGDSSYGSAGDAPRSAQDAAALRLFAGNGDRFSGAWNNPCTQSGGGSLR